MPPFGSNYPVIPPKPNTSLYSELVQFGLGAWTLSTLVPPLFSWNLRDDIRVNPECGAQCAQDMANLIIKELNDLCLDNYLGYPRLDLVKRNLYALLDHIEDITTSLMLHVPLPNDNFDIVVEHVHGIKDTAIFLHDVYGLLSPPLDYFLFIADTMEAEYHDAIADYSWAAPTTNPAMSTARHGTQRAGNEDDVFGADLHPSYPRLGLLGVKNDSGRMEARFHGRDAAAQHYKNFYRTSVSSTDQETMNRGSSPLQRPHHSDRRIVPEQAADRSDTSQRKSRISRKVSHLSSLKVAPYLREAHHFVHRHSQPDPIDAYVRRQDELRMSVEALRTRVGDLEAALPKAAKSPTAHAQDEPKLAEVPAEPSGMNAEKRWGLYNKYTLGNIGLYDHRQVTDVVTPKGKGEKVEVPTSNEENQALSMTSDDTFLVLTPPPSTTATSATETGGITKANKQRVKAPVQPGLMNS